MTALSNAAAGVAAIGIVGFAAGGFLLLGAVDLSVCDAPDRSRRARFVRLLACSPSLLGGGWREWLVVAWLWSWPVLLLGSFIALRRPQRHR